MKLEYQITDTVGADHRSGIVDFEFNPANTYSPLIEIPEPPLTSTYTLRLRLGLVYSEEETVWSDWSDPPGALQSDPLTDPNPPEDPEDPPEEPGALISLSVAFDTTTPRVERIDLTINRTAGSDSTLAEVKIDGSEWKPFFEGWYPLPATIRLRGADYPQEDQSGLIDRATQYRYSDGGLHTVSIRARMENDSNYVYADDFSAHLGNYGETGDRWRASVYHATFTASAQGITPWSATPHIQPVPHVEWPPNASYGEFWVKVDSLAPILFKTWPVDQFGLSSPKTWLYALPTEVKDGQPHQVRFRFATFDAEGALLSDSGFEPIRDYSEEPPTVYDTLPIPLPTAPPPPVFPTLIFEDHPSDPALQRVTLPMADIGIIQDALITGQLAIDQGSLEVLIDGYSLTPSEMHSSPTGLFFDIPKGLEGQTIRVSVRWVDQATGTQSNAGVLIKPFPNPKKTNDLIPPATLTAQLIRQADGPIKDQVRLQWPAGHLVELLIEENSTARRSSLGFADSTESEMMVENSRRKLSRTGQLTDVRFGVRAYQLELGISDTRLSPYLQIRALPPGPVTPANDPQVSYSQFVNDLATAHNKDTMMIDQILHVAFTKIKDIVAKGGSVEIGYFGKFSANWNLVKNERSARFTTHKAFSLGVQQGTVLP